MPDETTKVEVSKAKPWWKKFKLMVGIGTIVIDAVTILVSQLVTDPATKAIIIKMVPVVTTMGITLITGHTITDTARELKKK